MPQICPSCNKSDGERCGPNCSIAQKTVKDIYERDSGSSSTESDDEFFNSLFVKPRTQEESNRNNSNLESQTGINAAEKADNLIKTEDQSSSNLNKYTSENKENNINDASNNEIKESEFQEDIELKEASDNDELGSEEESFDEVEGDEGGLETIPPESQKQAGDESKEKDDKISSKLKKAGKRMRKKILQKISGEEEKDKTKAIHKLELMHIDKQNTTKVRLVIYSPLKDFKSDKSSLRIVFFSDTNRFDLTNSTTKLGDDCLYNREMALSKYYVDVSIPTQLLDEPSLSYTYYLSKFEDDFTSAKTNYIYERYAKDDKPHRKLPQFLINEIKSYQGTNTSANSTIIFYEGLVLFDKYKDKEIKEFNSECFGRMLNINDHAIDNINEIQFLIQKYQRVHECLVMTNTKNTEFFQETVVKEIELFKSKLKAQKLNCINDFHKALLLFYLYNSYELDVQMTATASVYMNILSFACDSSFREYFEYLSSLSTLPLDLKQILENVLLNYLSKKMQIGSSKTAYLVLIHCFHLTQSKDISTTASLEKNVFGASVRTVLELSHIKYSHKMHIDEFKSFQHNFQPTFYNVLFLNFFGSDEDTIKDMLNSNMFAIGDILYFLYVLTKKQNFPFELFNQVIKKAIEISRRDNITITPEINSKLFTTANFIYNQIIADTKLRNYWFILLNVLELLLVLNEKCIRITNRFINENDYVFYNWIKKYIEELQLCLAKIDIEASYGIKNQAWKKFDDSIKCTFMYEQYFYNYLGSINTKGFKVAKLFKEFLEELVARRLGMSEFISVITVRSNLKQMKLAHDFHEVFDAFIIDRLENEGLYFMNNNPNNQNEVRIMIEAFKNELETVQAYFNVLITKFERQIDIRWEHLVIYIFYHAKKLSRKVFNDHDSNCVRKAIKSHLERIKSIMNGDVLIQTLKNMKNGEEDLRKIDELIIENESDLALLKTSIASQVDLFEKLIEFRLKELEEYELYRKGMIEFIHWWTGEQFRSLCDLSVYEAKLIEESYETIILNKNVQVLPLDQIKKFKNSIYDYHPTVTFLKDIDRSSLNSIMDIVKLSKSSPVFLIGKLTEHLNSKVSLKQLLENVWLKCSTELMAITVEVLVGNILLSVIEDWCVVFGDNALRMAKEIENLAHHFMSNSGHSIDETNKIIDTRRRQITTYFRFKKNVQGANIIEEIRVKNKIKDPFVQLKPLLNLKDTSMRNQKLESLDEQFEKTANILSNLDNSEKVKCLQAFIDSFEFIEWLRKTTKDLVSLKFLIDIINTSTDTNENIKSTASLLYDVGTRYAPLIYGVSETDTFEKLIKDCEKVWQFLNGDKIIATKLIQLKDSIPLLEEIKKKGDVEASSLEKAKNGNESGIYIITNHKNVDLLSLQSIDSLIEFQVPSGKTTEKKLLKIDVKIYTSMDYDSIKKLQNILILSTRKTKGASNELDDSNFEISTVNYFVNVLDGVTRLAELYLKLIKSGCGFFNDLKVVVNCDYNKNYQKPILQFILDEYEFELSNEKTPKCLNEVCKFMDTCLQEWNKHINELRSVYDKMNYFTTSQIIFIQNTFKRIDDGTYTAFELEQLKFMLHRICESFNAQYLSRLCKDAEILMLNYDEMILNLRLESKVRDFIQKMNRDTGYPQKLIREAVKEFGISDAAKIDEFCLANYDKFSNEKDAVRIEKKPMHRTKEDNWESFLKGQTNVSNKTITIHRTAAIISILAQNKGKQYQRLKPGYLTHTGKPNLIIVPHSNQITVALSIYAMSPQCPLPSNDEVLYCSEETQCDEIESFLRIALMSNGHKIYTILHVEKLSFEAAKHADDCFQTLRSNDQYLLLILCSHGKDGQSPLASTFANNRVQWSYDTPETKTKIKNYLFEKLKQQSSNQVDPKQVSARALISERPGCGKTLFVKELTNKIQTLGMSYSIIPVKYRRLDKDKVIDELFENLKKGINPKGHVFHIDIAYEVVEEVQLFLFNLIVLGVVKHRNGLVWKRLSKDLYFIEKTVALNANRTPIHLIFDFIPSIFFRDPQAYLAHLNSNSASENFDISFSKIYKSEAYQCVCNYIKIWDDDKKANEFRFYGTGAPSTVNEKECLQLILEQLENPTWMEINNYVRFLNEQIYYCDQCNTFNKNIVPGFKAIYLKCLKLMSRDLALPALNLNDKSFTQPKKLKNNDDDEEDVIEVDLNKLSLKRGWSEFYHPFIIFNSSSILRCTADHSNQEKCFQFMGFFVCRKDYICLDSISLKPLKDFNYKIPYEMRTKFLERHYPIYRHFNENTRGINIANIREVLGLTVERYGNREPDQSYVLTMDNCLKLMAIYLRFRADIPVVIMGETGCGKTRLIKFLGDLHIPKNQSNEQNIQTLIHVKIHGGTTAETIKDKLDKAIKLSIKNYAEFYPGFDPKTSKFAYAPVSAILFFDEANTTEAISLIKEIMCERTCEGKPIDFSKGLKIIAACNPYKRHDPKMIEKLEGAGLGFFRSINETKDKFGQIPMRELVYRVQPLPPSILPLVWDFGELSTDVEKAYIKEMLNRNTKLEFQKEKADKEKQIDLLTDLLTESQTFMRKKRDECSFVSLRDIERMLKVAEWFQLKKSLIFPEMKNQKVENRDDGYQDSPTLTDLYRCFILSLAICYHASLKDRKTRKEYRNIIAKSFEIKNDNDWVLTEILKCQQFFISQIEINKNIAKNSALLENVFMMIICVELRIPLFIVGKPGSSKSLAKTIVMGAMQGKNSSKELFQNLKGAFFVNFQCSPLTTPDMIVNAFKSAASIQKGKDLNETVAVVNLDEIGLAEASESMPLKALHPLLEEGTDSDEMSEPYQKVAVIGISNWSLDPAKMNRGLIVSREEPDITDLEESAKGICNYDDKIFKNIQPYIKEIATGYLKLCDEARKTQREFFGLRDFYSLIKMIYWFCSRDPNNEFTWNKLEHALKRNFSGLDIDPLKFFNQLEGKIKVKQSDEREPKCGAVELVQAALRGDNIESNSRYLLLITENYTVLDIIQNYLINTIKTPESEIVVIFGSSFPYDLQETEISRNISKIRHCIELGKTVILLNFENIYESLYDALNQYYYEFAGQKYVDLGLGTHRVKCAVNDDFRLIIIADKRLVYNSKKFPIPLINRLEKHYMSASSILHEKEVVEEAKKWVNEMCNHACESQNNFEPAEMFIGYNEDTLPNLVLYHYQQVVSKENPAKEVIAKTKESLLQCATGDSIARIKFSRKERTENVSNEYFASINKHKTSLRNILDYHAKSPVFAEKGSSSHLIEVTSFSSLIMSQEEIRKLSHNMNVSDIKHYALNSFDTQQQFIDSIREFIERNPKRVETLDNAYDDAYGDVEMNEEKAQLERMLIIQAQFTDAYSMDLIFCARHVIVDEFKEASKKYCMDNMAIVFIVNIARENTTKFSGFQVSTWSCYHVDDLEELPEYLPSMDTLSNKTISKILLSFKNEGKSKVLLERCIDYSCSLIKDHSINRTMNRVATLRRFLRNDEFVEIFFAHLLKMQKQREDSSGSQMMIIKEISTIKRIKESITLRKSFNNYLIATILSPIIAYILSKIDAYSNMELFDKTSVDYIKILWLNIFKSELLKFDYDEIMSKESKFEELKQFKCKEDPKFANKAFNVPFFTKINEFINQMIQAYLKENLKQDEKFDTERHKGLFELFEHTPLYEEINKSFTTEKDKKDFFDKYRMSLANYTFEAEFNENLLKVVDIFLKDVLDNIQNNKLSNSLIMLHIYLKNFKNTINLFIKFSNSFPDVLVKIKDRANDEDIELSACKTCIREYKLSITTTNQESLMNRFELRNFQILVYMTQNYFAKNSEDKNSQLKNDFEVLNILNHFLNDVMKTAEFKTEETKRFISANFYTSFITKKYAVKDITRFFNICLKRYGEEVFKPKENCCTKKSGKSYYQIEDCKCIICDECRTNMNLSASNGTVKCKMCNKNIKTKFNQLENVQEFRQRFDSFKTLLGNFYCNILKYIINDHSNNEELNLIFENAYKIKTDENSNEDDLYSFNLKIKQCYFVTKFILKNTQHSDKLIKYLTENGDNISVEFLEAIFMADVENNLLEISSINKSFNNTYRFIRNNKAEIDRLFKTNEKRFDDTKLKLISELKTSLRILAFIATNYENVKSLNNLSGNVDNYLHEIVSIADIAGQTTNIMHICFIKEIILNYGFNRLRELKDIPNLGVLKTVNVSDNSFEMFKIIGEKYKNLRDRVNEAIISNNLKPLSDYLTPKLEQSFPYVYLSIYDAIRNLTFNNQDIKQVSDTFDNFLKSKYPKMEITWKQVTSNMFIHKSALIPANRPYENMNNLVEHFRIAITVSTSKLAKPLFDLMNKPNTMQKAFFPTMPGNNLLEIQTKLIGKRSNDIPKFYSCKNGHMFVLFNFESPKADSKCEFCEIEIGRADDKAISTENLLKNLSYTGYVINDENNNEIQTFEFYVMRFLINLSCYIACDKQDVRSLLSCKVPENPKDFFWDDLVNTAEKIRNLSLLNNEEFFFIMHSILQNILEKTDTAKQDFNWFSLEKRSEWEKSFTETFLNCNIKKIIKSALEQLDKNGNQNTKSLVSAYLTSPNLNENCFYASERFWKNEKPISFDTFYLDLQSQTQQESFKFLKQFFELRNKFESVNHLYAIATMVNALKKEFEGSIFRKNALEKTVRSLNVDHREEIEQGVESLSTIWLRSREKVIQHALDNIQSLPRCALDINFTKGLSLDSKLTYFLPTKEGHGLTSYLIIHYLCNIHNEILNNYDFIDTIKKVNLLDMSEENIIQVDKEDLMAIIRTNYLSNNADDLSFNYKAVEEDIVNKFLENKILLDLDRIPEFEYAEDMMSESIAVLNNIEQDFLDPETQKDIFNEYKEQSEICEAINFLKYVINLVDNTVNEPEMLLSDFCNKFLGQLSEKIGNVLKPKTMEEVYLKHIQHLWLILKTRQTFIYAQNSKTDHQFDMLDDAFKLKFQNELSISTNNAEVVSLLIFTYQLLSFLVSSEFRSSDKIKDCVQARMVGYRETVDSNLMKYLSVPDYVENVAMKQLTSLPKMENILDIWTKLVKHLKTLEDKLKN